MLRFLLIFGCLFVIATAGFGQAEIEMQKGDEFYKKGKYAESITHYNKAITLNPENLNAYIQRGLAYSITKDYQKAVDDFSHVLEQQPSLIAIIISRGTALLKLKQYEAAMADFNKALGLDDKNQEAYNNRGWCKKYLGDQKGACEDWKTSKKLGNGEAKIIMQNNGC